MARKKHLINVHTNTGNTAPSSANLYLGEIAVQHTSGSPALWIKVGSSESSTAYEKFIGKTEITNLLDDTKILGSGYTYSGIPYVNSSTTIADAYSALTSEVIDDEYVMSSALNYLNDNIEELCGITMDLAEELLDLDELSASVVSNKTSLEELSAGTLYEFRLTNHNIPYVVQSGDIYTGTSARCEAVCDEISELKEGQSIILHLKRGTTTASTNGLTSAFGLNLTLSGGTETGWKTVYYGGLTKVTTHYGGGNDIRLTYHENLTISGTTGLTGWWIEGNYDSNTVPNYLYYFGIVKSDDAFAKYSLAMQTSAGTWNSLVTASTTAATKTPTSKGFLLGSDILYYNNTLAANSTGGNSYGYCAIYAFDFRYSSNAGSTLVKGLPVYLVGTVNPNDGLFYLDSTAWWSQTLPQTDDGKVYIFVGVAYDSYNVTLWPEHPIFQYKNGHVREYQEDNAPDMILGGDYTYSGIPYVNSSTSIADAYSALTNELILDEIVMSSALNRLNDDIVAVSAAIPDISFVPALSASVVANKTKINSLSGSVVTNANNINNLSGVVSANAANIQVLSAGLIDDELAIAASLNDLNDRMMLLSGYAESLSAIIEDDEFVIANALNDLHGKISEVSGWAADASIVQVLSAGLIDDELAIASSLNDLNNRVEELSAASPDLSIVTELSASVINLSAVVEDNEFVVSAALNDLDDRVYAVSGSVGTLKASMVTQITNTSTDSEYPTAKAAYNAIHPPVITSGGTASTITVQPNIVYNFGTLTGTKTFALATPTDSSIANHYFWTFDAGSTAPTINWPNGITWYGGSSPSVSASHHYEISVMNNIAVAMEV